MTYVSFNADANDAAYQMLAPADHHLIAKGVGFYSYAGASPTETVYVFGTDFRYDGDSVVAGTPKSLYAVDGGYPALEAVFYGTGGTTIGQLHGLSAKAQVALLLSGDDTIQASTAGSHVNVLIGGAGNDTLGDGPGQTRIDGGTGVNTALLHVKFADASVSVQGNAVVIAAPGYQDHIVNVDHFQFVDRAFDSVAALAAASGPVGTTQASLTHGDFDASYYLAHNPDVAAAAAKTGGSAAEFAWTHYDTFGWHEGRDPNALFSTAGYLAANPDVAKAGIDPLTHYNVYGWHEGRDPSDTFHTDAYLAANPDVAAAGVDPLQHYLQFGASEGRHLA